MKLKKYLITLVFLILFLVFFCEFLIYFIVLVQCKWPQLSGNPLRVMLIADTHLLGPFRGHWLDKLRREWQMHRSFQTAITLFSPEHVFFLGDVFDEGNWVSRKQFHEYVARFHEIFSTPASTKIHAIVGNHDIGFHYATMPILIDRFYGAFNTSGVQLTSIKDIHFVTINSIAMEHDGCVMCQEAERELAYISYQLNCARGLGKNCEKFDKLQSYSRPIVLQHFPMYRKSDEECVETNLPKIDEYKQRWDVLSKDSTKLIGKMLEPRVAFSGHTHFYCYIKNKILKIEEYTIQSFSCRNVEQPSFLLVEFTKDDYKVVKCDMPKETTVITIYVIGLVISLLFPLFSKQHLLKPLRFTFFKRFNVGFKEH